MASMATDPNVRTLYDDWQARRQRLERMPGEEADYRAVEIRLLDYLLRRYRASPEAARPARFPLPTGLFVNHRAIVVHHHLGRGAIPNITNEQEAEIHVRAIVARMQTPATAAQPPGSHQETAGCAAGPEDDPVETARMNLCHADPAIRIRAALELGAAAVWRTSGCYRTCSRCPSGPTNFRASERPCSTPCIASRASPPRSSICPAFCPCRGIARPSLPAALPAPGASSFWRGPIPTDSCSSLPECFLSSASSAGSCWLRHGSPCLAAGRTDFLIRPIRWTD